jgi:hypothetical protein
MRCALLGLACGLLLQSGQRRLHIGHAFEHRLPVCEHAGRELVLAGAKIGLTRAPIEQGDVDHGAKSQQRIVLGLPMRGEVGRPHHRAADAKARQQIRTGFAGFAGRLQHPRFGSSDVRAGTEQVGGT